MVDASVGFVIVLMWILPYFMLVLYCTKGKLGFTSLLVFGLITWMWMLQQYLSSLGVLL